MGVTVPVADVLLWLVVAEGVGLVAWPFAYLLFPFLKDRGYALSKPLGLLLLTYPVWLLGSLHLIPATRAAILAVLVLLAVGGIGIFWRRRREMEAFVRREWGTLLVTEAVFLVLFLAWVGYRLYDPAIAHTEQPMDLAFLNASMKARFFPPEDPWLAGFPISYYYLGHLMAATLTELSGIFSAVAYNLALALWAALAGAAIFSLVVTLVAAANPSRGIRAAWAYGLLGVVLLVGVSNLLGVLEFLRLQGVGSAGFWQWLQVKGLESPSLVGGWLPQDHWWWWRSTRVVDTLANGQSLDYTITEFPYFSFLLGDLHAHLLSLPFVLLVLGFCLNLLLDPTAGVAPYARRRLPFLMTLALALGALGFLNAWDLPTFALVVAGAVFLSLLRARPETSAWSFYAPHSLRLLHASPQAFLLRAGLRPLPFLGLVLPSLLQASPKALRWVLYAPHSLRLLQARPEASLLRTGLRALPVLGLVLPLALLLYAPFYASFSNQASGLLPVEGPVSRPVHLVLLWGLFLVPVVVVVATHLVFLVRQQRRLSGHALVAAGVVAAPFLVWALASWVLGRPEAIVGRFLHLLPFLALAWASLYGLLEGARLRVAVPLLVILGLAFVAVMLLMAPELFYVLDVFNSRMNTLFKLAYQAWLLLALASAGSLYYWREALGRAFAGWKLAHYGGLGLFVLLLIGSLYYPMAAAYSKSAGFGGQPTLDGLAYVKQEVPGEYEAIRALWERAPEGARVLEAVGGEWSSYGRISASTGLPTLLEWEGHERQWRGSSKPMEGRSEAVDRIYGTLDAQEADDLLMQYDIQYVVVGPREVSKYGLAAMAKFAAFMEHFFSQDGFVIYQRRPAGGGG